MWDVYFPFGYAAGISSGGSTRRILSMGNNPSIDTTTQPEDVWSGASLGILNSIDHRYVQRPQSPVQMEVVSDSANDTAAGTGARSIRVTYLDALLNERIADITMNGLTPVPLPTTALRVNLAQVLTSGSFGGTGGANAGNISIRLQGGLGATYSYMVAGVGNARSTLYTVPKGLRYDLISLTTSVNRVDTSDRWATVNICFQPLNGGLIKGTELSASSNTPYRHETADVPLVSTGEGTDIWVRCEAVSVNNTNISVSLTGIQRIASLQVGF